MADHFREPVAASEWADAVDAAHACLALHAARMYGLVTGGPGVNIERCEDILTRGAAHGIQPGPDVIAHFLGSLQ